VPTAEVEAHFGHHSTLAMVQTVSLGAVPRQTAALRAWGGLEYPWRFAGGRLETPLIETFERNEIAVEVSSPSGALELPSARVLGFTQATVTGVIADRVNGGAVSVSGAGVFKAANTYTGTTTVVGDRFVLTEAGSILNSPLVVVEPTGTLELNNFPTHTNRIGDTATVRFSGGELRYKVHGGELGERVGRIDVANRHSSIFGGDSDFVAGQMTRARGATAEIGGVRLLEEISHLGDGLSATHRPIVPWLILGRAFATYDQGADGVLSGDDFGFRALDAATEISAAMENGANVNLAASTTLDRAWQLNSLVLQGVPLNLGSGDLTLTSGGLMLLTGDFGSPAGVFAPPGDNSRLISPGELILYAQPTGRDFPVRVSHVVDAAIEADSLTVTGLTPNDVTTIQLNRPNTIHNGTTINHATVVLRDPLALGAAPITLAGSIEVDLAAATLGNDLILRGGGGVHTSKTSRLTLGGRISGDGDLRISAGTTHLAGGDGPGAYHVHATVGTLVIASDFTSPDGTIGASGIDGAAIFGSGLVRGKLRPTGAVVSPGDHTAQPAAIGKLTVGQIEAYGAVFQHDIARRGVGGIDYDQLAVLDRMFLSPLEVNDNGLDVRFVGGFMPSLGDSFTIFDNQFAGPVDGFFRDMPEGALFAAGNVQMQISYTGGDGNDVVLTAVPEPTAWALAVVCASAMLVLRIRQHPRFTTRLSGFPSRSM
jgi:hypothetical protein